MIIVMVIVIVMINDAIYVNKIDFVEEGHKEFVEFGDGPVKN